MRSMGDRGPVADPTLILPEVSPRPPMEPAPAQSGVVEVTEPLPIPGVDPPTERARPTGPARIAGAGDEPGREGHRKAEVSDELPTLAYMPRLRLDGASIRSSDSPVPGEQRLRESGAGVRAGQPPAVAPPVAVAAPQGPRTPGNVRAQGGRSRAGSVKKKLLVVNLVVSAMILFALLLSLLR